MSTAGMSTARFARLLRWFFFFAVQALAALASGRSRLYAQDAAARPIGAYEQLVPVAARSLTRGQVLTERDISTVRLVTRAPSANVSGAVAPGWVTRRVIRSGEVLREPAVAPAPLVRGGQPVKFTYVQNGLRLTLDGVASADAEFGETVAVRLGAKRRLAGVVTGPARVVANDSLRIS